MRIRLLTAMVAAAFLVGVCAHDQNVEAGSSSTTEPGPTTTATSTVPKGGGSSDALVFRVLVCCGMGYPGHSPVPSLSVMADGTAYVLGTDPAYNGGSALPDLKWGHISSPDLAAIIEQAGADGFLAGKVDFGSPGITDVDTTTVTIVADGRSHELSAYALGIEPGVGPLPAEFEARRSKLSALVALARKSVHDAARVYVPDRISVFASPMPDATNGVVTPTPRAWPLDDPTAWEPRSQDVTPCHTYSGPDAETVFSAAQAAKSGDVWTAQGGTPHVLEFRSLLPDEDPACSGG